MTIAHFYKQKANQFFVSGCAEVKNYEVYSPDKNYSVMKCNSTR